MSKRIPLTQGKFATVDNRDYKWLMKWKWFALRDPDGNFHAVRLGKPGKKDQPCLIHMDQEVLRRHPD